MASSRAAFALHEPRAPFASCWRLADGQGMGDSETIERTEEALRVFEPFDRRFIVAEQPPALGDAREQLRTILEA